MKHKLGEKEIDYILAMLVVLHTFSHNMSNAQMYVSINRINFSVRWQHQRRTDAETNQYARDWLIGWFIAFI